MANEPMTEALHPDPAKQGTQVRRAAYNAYRKALLKLIPKNKQGVEFRQLAEGIEELLPAKIAASTKAMWWVTTVKLDLEARGLIERVPDSSPQRLRRM